MSDNLTDAEKRVEPPRIAVHQLPTGTWAVSVILADHASARFVAEAMSRVLDRYVDLARVQFDASAN